MRKKVEEMPLVAECRSCKTRISGPVYLKELMATMAKNGWLVDDIDPRCPRCIAEDQRASYSHAGR